MTSLESTDGDGSAHLPAVPEDVRRANATHIARRLLEKLGGHGSAGEE